LFAALEGARRLSLGAKRLDGIHQLFLLFQKSFAQLNRPRQVVAHQLDHCGEFRDGLDAVIPIFTVNVGDIVSVLDEARRQHDFHRIDRGWQDTRDQWVRVERNRGRQVL